MKRIERLLVSGKVRDIRVLIRANEIIADEEQKFKSESPDFNTFNFSRQGCKERDIRTE